MAKRGPRKKAQKPLEEIAQAVATGEAEPGPETPEEAEQISPEEIAALTVAPEDQADPVPRETDLGVVASPTGILRQIVLGNVAPEGKPGPLVCGAKVAFSYRPNKWKDAEALIVAKVGDDGTIFIDLEVGGELCLILMVPYGSGTRCWKFRE